MTDPFSASRRSRRRSGRHRQQPVRRTESSPLPPEQARRNRDAAFGGANPKRTWIAGPAEKSSASPEPQPSPEPEASPAPDPRPASASASASAFVPEHQATPAPQPSSSPSPEASPAPAAPASPASSPEAAAPGSQTPARPAPRRPRGRRAAFPLDQIEDSPAVASSADEPGTSLRGRRAAADPSAAGGPALAASAGASAAPAAADDAAPAGVAANDAGPGDVAAGAAGTEHSPAAASSEDVWTTSGPSEEAAPLSPGAEPSSATPHRSTEASAGSDASSAPQVVAGRRTSLAAGTGVAAAGSGAAAADGDAVANGSAAAGGASGTGWSGSGGRGTGGRGPDSEDAPEGDGTDGPSDSGTASADGSFAKVAGWTVLTSALPGTGLMTTRMRRIGVVMLALLLLAVATVVALLVIFDPLRLAATLGTHRGVLIGALVVAVVVGLVWCLQIVLANLAQSTKQRLAGAKRYLALALAAVMVIAVAVPFGRGVQSLWALQGLFGSTTVFGGDGGELADGPDPWADTPRLNIMLLGQDAGADRTGTRPDTIMVASIDTETGQTALFSIPRNLENVEFPEGTVAAEEFPDGFDYYGPNENLINAVWAWAEENPDLFPGDPEPGLTATRWAVEETLGISTDYYAMVNLQGFEDLVDALGGVDLVVERRIPIGGGASEVEGYIEPGEQTLDGYHALWYARSREGSDDFNRMCRQQRIVRAVSEEADPTSLAMSIPRLVTATEENIQTDIPVRNVDAFVELALRIKEGGFTSYPITQDVTFSGNADWEYLEEWVDASIEDSMTKDAPESVKGETEPGSNDPAETGAPPEEDTGSEEETTEEEEEETTTEEETTSEEAEDTEEAEPTDAPEIEKDPLKSCLPGAEQ